MVNPKLLDYIRQQSAAGVSKEDISKALIAIGWKVADIQEALFSFPNLQSATTSAPGTIIPPVEITVQAQSPRSHKLMWTIVIIVWLLIGGGGAFAAYYFGLFTPPAPSASPAVSPSPTLPVAATSSVPLPAPAVGTTSAPLPPPALVATSTSVAPPPMNPSDVASLTANLALTLPSAKLTVNASTSVIASASTFTLKWSSTNADTFSATQSVTSCVIPVMNEPEAPLTKISSAKGTSYFTFVKNDLALLSGCVITITYNVENAKSAQKAQSAVTVSFPSNDSTTQQLINMTSLRAKTTSPVTTPSAPAPAPATTPSAPPPATAVSTSSTSTPPPPAAPPAP